MIDKEKTCTACSGSGYYCGRNCGACNGTGLEYSKDDIIEALEAELEKLQNTSSNSDYAKSCETCVYGVDGCQHEPPCNTGAGKPHYEKLNYA